MTFVIVVVFINIQLIIDESLPQVFPNQINEPFTKINMFVRQQYMYSSETNQLTFIKRHRAFESCKLHLLFSFLFIYLSFIYIFSIYPAFVFFYMFILFSVIRFINIFNTFIQIKFAYDTFS